MSVSGPKKSGSRNCYYGSVSGPRNWQKTSVSGSRNWRFLSVSFLDPETDIMDQFLGPETDIMGEGNFMQNYGEHANIIIERSLTVEIFLIWTNVAQ